MAESILLHHGASRDGCRVLPHFASSGSIWTLRSSCSIIAPHEGSPRGHPDESAAASDSAGARNQQEASAGKPLIVGVALMTVSRVSGLVLPGSMQYLIDDVVAKNNYKILTPLILVVVAATICQAASTLALNRAIISGSLDLVAEMRQRAQRHAARVPLRYFDDTTTGKVSRIMNDIESIQNLVGDRADSVSRRFAGRAVGVDCHVPNQPVAYTPCHGVHAFVRGPYGDRASASPAGLHRDQPNRRAGSGQAD